MKQLNLKELKKPTKKTSKKDSKKSSQNLKSLEIIESAKTIWALRNKRTKKLISNIILTQFGKKISIGTVFLTRQDARNIKKEIKKAYPRRSYEIIKIDLFGEKDDQ